MTTLLDYLKSEIEDSMIEPFCSHGRRRFRVDQDGTIKDLLLNIRYSIEAENGNRVARSTIEECSETWIN